MTANPSLLQCAAINQNKGNFLEFQSIIEKKRVDQE